MLTRTLLKCLSFAAPLALAAPVAFAGADCTKYPESEHLHVLAMQKKIVNEYGFAIKKFLQSDNCYEIYGWGLNDEKTEFVRVEVYFDMKTGEIVKKKVD